MDGGGNLAPPTKRQRTHSPLNTNILNLAAAASTVVSLDSTHRHSKSSCCCSCKENTAAAATITNTTTCRHNDLTVAAAATMMNMHDENKINVKSPPQLDGHAAINGIVKSLMGTYSSLDSPAELASFIDQAVYTLKKADTTSTTTADMLDHNLWASLTAYRKVKENSNSENQNTNDPAVNTPPPTATTAASSSSSSSNGSASTTTGQQSNGTSGLNTNNSNNNGESVHEDAANSPASLVKSELPFNKKEFSKGQRDILRVIGQFLRYLGLNKTTEMLIDESGCMLEHPAATTFCSLVMTGNWDEVSDHTTLTISGLEFRRLFKLVFLKG